MENLFQKYCAPGEFGKLLKFGLTGVVNTLVDCLVFALLNSSMGVSYEISQAYGYLAGMLNSYLINRRWTFKSKKRFFSLQTVKFICVNLAVLLLSIGLLKFFIELAGMQSMPAKLVTVFVTMGINFILSRLWVFRG